MATAATAGGGDASMACWRAWCGHAARCARPAALSRSPARPPRTFVNKASESSCLLEAPPEYAVSTGASASFESLTGTSSSSSGSAAGALVLAAAGAATGAAAAAVAAAGVLVGGGSAATELLASDAPASGSAVGGGQQGSFTGSVAAQRAMASCRSSVHERPGKFASTLIEPNDTRRLSCRFSGTLDPEPALDAFCLPASARVGPPFLRWIAWIFCAAACFSASWKRAFLPRATAAILAAAMSSLLGCACTRGACGYSSGGAAGLERKLRSGIAAKTCGGKTGTCTRTADRART